MYVNKIQKFFCYAGFHCNHLLRQSTRNIERLTRPMPQGPQAYRKECLERIQRVALTVLSLPFTLPSAALGLICYSLASCLGKGRFERIEIPSCCPVSLPESIRLFSNNTCFQDPWSPLTGGMETPFTKNEQGTTRIEDYAQSFEEGVDYYQGQEYDVLSAQDALIEQLSAKGFRYFIRDLVGGNPICNSSGLFVASKFPFLEEQFIAYPLKDRAGLAKGSSQGALVVKMQLASGKVLTLINTHLNYGEGEENQQARNRQLKTHILPHLRQGAAVLAGDLNFDTTRVSPKESGLEGFENAIAGKVSCSDEGKHSLRGKKKQSCSDCEEIADGLIYDPQTVQVTEVRVQPIRKEGRLLTDHFGVFAKLQPR